MQISLMSAWDGWIAEFRNVSLFEEVGVLVCCLFLSWLLEQFVGKLGNKAQTKQLVTAHTLGRRFLFPVLALFLVLIGRELLRPHYAVGLLNLAVPLLWSTVLVRAFILALRYTFPGARDLVRLENIISGLVWLCLVLYLTGWSEVLIEAMEAVRFSVGRQKLDLWMLVHGLATALSSLLLALWLAGWLERRLLRSEGLDSSLRIVLSRMLKAALSVVSLLVALALVGFDMTVLSVFGGAFAVGLGFGLKTIASNYVAGFMILLDRSIRIGNLITLDTMTTGVVQRITTRYTVVRTGDGSDVIVPNEYLVTNIVRNQTYADTQLRLHLKLAVTYGSNVPEAMRLLEEAARAQAQIMPSPAPCAVVLGLSEHGVDLELGFWVRDAAISAQELRSAIYLTVLKTFMAQGITLASPRLALAVDRHETCCVADSAG